MVTSGAMDNSRQQYATQALELTTPPRAKYPAKNRQDITRPRRILLYS